MGCAVWRGGGGKPGGTRRRGKGVGRGVEGPSGPLVADGAAKWGPTTPSAEEAEDGSGCTWVNNVEA